MIEKFKKRPVIIEAEQFVVYKQHPVKFITVNSVTYPVRTDKNGEGWYIEIPTLEGVMICNNLDWIIKGVQGEFYPCKPDIFEKTYQRI
jgi:hypothetical protein